MSEAYQEAVKARQKAIDNNESRYLSPRACPKGHKSERFTDSGGCCECAALRQASEAKREYDRKRYQKNKESIKKRANDWHKSNPEESIKKASDWAKNNKDKFSAIKKNYKAKRRAQMASGVSGKELANWIKDQPKNCYWCGVKCKENYHIDHYEPLARGGKHELDNLVISCDSCNVRKNAKDPYQFAQEVGRLL